MASLRLAAAAHRVVSHYWPKRSIEMIGYQLPSWPTKVLEDKILLLDSYTPSSSGRDPITLLRMTVFASINILLNKYCFIKNDVFAATKLAKRIKSQTPC